MSSELDVWGPLATQFGVGGLGGLCVGFAVKKIAKIVAVIVGIVFVGLEYLAYKDIIKINYGVLQAWAENLIGGVGAAQSWLSAVVANLPFAASFIAGFGIGLKMG